MPRTAKPTTRFGACLMPARRLVGVEDRATVGARETWIDYQAVRVDSGAAHAESLGCLFVATESPEEIVLEAIANNQRVPSAGARDVLNDAPEAAGRHSSPR